VLPWIRQVCDALEYLHTRTPPIIHRDIKPRNIVITPDNRAVLVDFGISKAYNVDHTTTMGARAVTHGFSPPEQYGVGRTDTRSDVYALGATLYMLLTGRVPPDGPDLASGTAFLEPPRALNPAISEATGAAIVASMAPTISQRLGSAGLLRSALSPGATPAAPTLPLASPLPPTAQVGALTEGDEPSKRSGPVAPGGPIDPGRPVKPGRFPWHWAGSALGLVVLIAVIFWAWSSLGGRAETTTPAATAQAGLTTEATPPPATLQAATTAPTAEPTAAATPEPTVAPTAQPSPTPTVTAEPPQLGDVRAAPRGGVVAEEVFVPAGSFVMGSDAGAANEQPSHDVTLDAFWLDRTEVTNAQFAAFVADTGYVTAAERAGGGNTATASGPTFTAGADWRHPLGPDSSLDGRDEHPVVLVTWHDAAAFCAWAGGRLPSEAEWEYAARGAAGLVYPWGNEFDGPRLNTCDHSCPLPQADTSFDDSFNFTAPAGSFRDGASWVGILDMSGNAWEWVNDWYAADAYATSPAENPTGPPTGDARVLRGGAWSAGRDNARASFRSFAPPEGRGNSVGFRCAQRPSE
jgi:serine/threonine-protein kinase